MFTFLRDGFNIRSTDLHAKLGLLQLPNLDSAIEERNENFSLFLSKLDSESFRVDFDVEGCSNFAFPIFTKNNNIDDIKDLLRENGVEYEHPFMNFVEQSRFDKNANEIHNNCIYIGNHKDITHDMIETICSELNTL